MSHSLILFPNSFTSFRWEFQQDNSNDVALISITYMLMRQQIPILRTDDVSKERINQLIITYHLIS